jgi:solute carrier family 38 (sodium-coupled neutral amino acid transporter), member 11
MWSVSGHDARGPAADEPDADEGDLDLGRSLERPLLLSTENTHGLNRSGSYSGNESTVNAPLSSDSCGDPSPYLYSFDHGARTHTDDTTPGMLINANNPFNDNDSDIYDDDTSDVGSQGNGPSLLSGYFSAGGSCNSNTKKTRKGRDPYDDMADRVSDYTALAMQPPQNTFWLTIFLLVNGAIGSGILNQPYCFYSSGIGGGIIGFVIASVFTWTGLNLLTIAGETCNVLHYSQLATAAYGYFGGKTVDVAIVISALGAQLSYIVVLGSLLSSLLVSWGCSSDMCSVPYTTSVAIGSFVTPIILYRHFGDLAIISVFSIATIFSVLMMVLIAGPSQQSSITTDLEPVHYLNGYGLLSSFGSMVFSIAIGPGNFQGYVATVETHRNVKSWLTITGITIIVSSSMCVVMGISGYLAFRQYTDGDILDNFTTHSFDVFKLFVCVHLILYIPLNFVIMRYSIVSLITGKRSELLPTMTHSAVSVTLLFLTTLAALMLTRYGLSSGQAFSVILNITGGVGGSLSTFILPAAIYLKIVPPSSGNECDVEDDNVHNAGPSSSAVGKSTFVRICAWVLLVGGLAVMATVITSTLLSFV